MDRISKLAIVCWSVAALLVVCYYVSGAWHAALVIGPAILIGVAAAAAFDRRAVAFAGASAYIFPLAIWGISGLERYHVHYSVAWLAAVLGAILPDQLRTGWRIPVRWRVPLVCWTAGVCVTAPVIALRAVDFKTELLFRGRLPLEALGGFPLLTLTWVIHAALLLAIGVLWFDWLCGLDETFFFRWVILPMAASVLGLASLAIYQLFVDVHFWNVSVFAAMARASGTMMDANVTGILAAIWLAGWSAVAIRSGRQWAAPVIASVLWLAVWASGSRTAFAAAAVISVLSLFAFARGRMRLRTTLAAGLIVLLAIAALLLLVSRTTTIAAGPLTRIAVLLPEPTPAGVAGLVRELWNRNLYGVAAGRALRAYPLFGIGVGSFHEMASEFVNALPPDNAQNWFRHQFVELGVIGSIAWVVFVISFGWWVLRVRRDENPLAWCPRAAILGVTAVSLLGVPGQDPAVALTFWTMCGWYVFARGGPASVAGGKTTTFQWTAALAVVAVFAGGTIAAAIGPLRVPARIQRAGGEYLYGYYWPEPDGEGGEYRWTRRNATAVVPAPTRSLQLTLRVNHADLADHPSQVRAWVDGRLVIDDLLTAAAPEVTRPVLLREGERHVLIDTRAARAVVALPPDGRELAVMVRWRFLPYSR